MYFPSFEEACLEELLREAAIEALKTHVFQLVEFGGKTYRVDPESIVAELKCK